MAELKPVEKLKYEQAISELEAIVASLEKGEQPLDQTTEIYTRGQALIKHCTQLLEKAELKVRILSDESSDRAREAA